MKLSICCITYNHEKFINEAIDSFLMQKTDFDVEIVIGEDCSTDNTRKICEEYAAKFPNLIKLLPSENNLGMMSNFVRTFQNCSGKYIALCEGDDYWTDPYKLQKQVDFLEANEDYSIVGHYTDVIDEATKRVIKTWTCNKLKTELKDVIFGMSMHTSAFCFRNGLGLPPNFNQIGHISGDDVFLVHITSKGHCYVIPEIMSVYRISTVGTWSTLSDTEKRLRKVKIALWMFQNYKVRVLDQFNSIGYLVSIIIKNKEPLNKYTNNKELILCYCALCINFSYRAYFFLKRRLKLSLFSKS